MVEEATPVKPPPQIAGVVGIAATPVTMNEPRAPAIHWGVLIHLPPFQIFAAERTGTILNDSLALAQAFVEARGPSEQLFNEYAAWHTASGKWPKETPMGTLKE